MSKKQPYHVIADNFSSVRISSYNPEKFKTTEEQKQRIDAFAAEQMRRVREKGGLFFDGDLVGILMDSFKADDGQLSFDTQKIKYFQHAGLFRTDRCAPIQAMAVNSVMITSDGMIVFGKKQATEAGLMDKLGIPAGLLSIGPDGMPSLGAQIYREMSEEAGITPDYHIEDIVLGWTNGMSTRERNYHMTTSFVTLLKMPEKALNEWFDYWKFGQEHLMKTEQAGKKTEFDGLHFIPNDPQYLRQIIEEQDEKWKNANLGGKSLDVIEAWVERYNCDISQLKASKSKGNIYLPQPAIAEA